MHFPALTFMLTGWWVVGEWMTDWLTQSLNLPTSSSLLLSAQPSPSAPPSIRPFDDENRNRDVVARCGGDNGVYNVFILCRSTWEHPHPVQPSQSSSTRGATQTHFTILPRAKWRMNENPPTLHKMNEEKKLKWSHQHLRNCNNWNCMRTLTVIGRMLYLPPPPTFAFNLWVADVSVTGRRRGG